jgi:hypothetical protein
LDRLPNNERAHRDFGTAREGDTKAAHRRSGGTVECFVWPIDRIADQVNIIFFARSSNHTDKSEFTMANKSRIFLCISLEGQFNRVCFQRVIAQIFRLSLRLFQRLFRG